MPHPNNNPVIAEKKCTYDHPVNGPRPVSVFLGSPRTEKDRDWYYPWQILGVGSEKIVSSVGIDGFQAIQLAIIMISATLLTQMQQNGVKLSWLDPNSQNLGFAASY